MTLTYIVRLTVAAGKNAALEAILCHVRDETRANEPGVVYYDFAVSADDPNAYVVVEVYRDQAAQESHMQTEWVRASIPLTSQLLQSIDIKRYVSPRPGSVTT